MSSDPAIHKALSEHKPGEADHLEKDDLAFALRLTAASRKETDRITTSLLDEANRRADEERARADAAELDFYAIASLQQMLTTPKFARALMKLLVRELRENTPEE